MVGRLGWIRGFSYNYSVSNGGVSAMDCMVGCTSTVTKTRGPVFFKRITVVFEIPVASQMPPSAKFPLVSMLLGLVDVSHAAAIYESALNTRT
jgi:hypothetical protein